MDVTLSIKPAELVDLNDKFCVVFIVPKVDQYMSCQNLYLRTMPNKITEDLNNKFKICYDRDAFVKPDETIIGNDSVIYRFGFMGCHAVEEYEFKYIFDKVAFIMDFELYVAYKNMKWILYPSPSQHIINITEKSIIINCLGYGTKMQVNNFERKKIMIMVGSHVNIVLDNEMFGIIYPNRVLYFHTQPGIIITILLVS